MPEGAPPDCPAELGWPYFFLYVWEGVPTSQLRVAFTAKRDRQYRVEIEGGYPDGEMVYKLRAQAWLDWQQ
jgi:hypothetical protein